VGKSVCRPVCLYAEFLIKFRFSGEKLGMLVVLTFWHHQPLGRGIVEGAKLLNMKFDPGNDSAEKSNQYAGTRGKVLGAKPTYDPTARLQSPVYYFIFLNLHTLEIVPSNFRTLTQPIQTWPRLTLGTGTTPSIPLLTLLLLKLPNFTRCPIRTRKWICTINSTLNQNCDYAHRF